MKIKNIPVVMTVLASVLSAGYVSAATSAAATFTPEQEARIGQIAEDYLLAHPDVLVRVSEKLQQMQEEQKSAALTAAVLKNQEALLLGQDTPSVGPAGAKVAVIEFFDYQCVYCARLAPELEKTMKARPDVRYIFKEWPIFAERWETSKQAATTGLQIWKAKGADAYLAYHNGIYATGHNEGRLTKEDIRKAAGDFDDSKAPEVKDELFRTNILAQQLGLTGTPGLIVMPVSGATAANTTVIPGFTSAEALQAAIDKAAGQAGGK